MKEKTALWRIVAKQRKRIRRLRNRLAQAAADREAADQTLFDARQRVEDVRATWATEVEDLRGKLDAAQIEKHRLSRREAEMQQKCRDFPTDLAERDRRIGIFAKESEIQRDRIAALEKTLRGLGHSAAIGQGLVPSDEIEWPGLESGS